MAQHDMNIANQGFPAFRADLNDALGALVSNSSGATAPSTTFAHQFWVDTAADPSVLKIRNADNDAWITIGAIDQTGDTFILRPAAGSASVPAYSTSGDTNTGIFFPTADTIGLTVGGVEAARLVSGLLSVPANSTAASAVRLYEDTDNGTNYVDIIAPAAITSDRTLTLPDLTGTVSLATYTIQVFTSGSGTYTTPAGCKAILVKCWGGGGSGGGGNGSTARGTGGGGGGFCQKLIASPSATYSYAVGSGGAAVGQGAAGNAGGNTTFGSLTANGGSAGTAATGTALGGPAGGTASGGDLNITGASAFTLNNIGYAGWGGSSPQGGSGGQSNITSVGLAPGGGGASANFTGNSGAGAAGAITVEEFY